MTERVTLAILAVLALIACAAVVLAWHSAADSAAVAVLRDIAIGLVGALGGGAALRAARNRDGGEG